MYIKHVKNILVPIYLVEKTETKSNTFIKEIDSLVYISIQFLQWKKVNISTNRNKGRIQKNPANLISKIFIVFLSLTLFVN